MESIGTSEKCHLAKSYDKWVCKMSHYLSNVKSLLIGSIIAKNRLDVSGVI